MFEREISDVKRLTAEKEWLQDSIPTNFEKRPETPFNPNDER